MLLVLIPATTFVWNDCPYNKTDCPSRRERSLYVDVDNDQICDFSQS